MKRYLLLAVICTICYAASYSQNVFNAADPLVRYSSSAPYGSAQKPDTNITGLQKWVAASTNGVSSGSGSFNNSSYKAYYINYFGTKLAFRLKYPRSFTNGDSSSKRYPVMLFMHGAGEVGCSSNGGIYNNEKQLVHGGKLFMDRVDNNQFDGFLLYPQINAPDGSCWGEWGGLPSAKFNTVITIIDSLVKYARLDIDRVFVDGLSGGGVATWRMAEGYPTRIAAAAPTSAAGLTGNYGAFVHIPIWLATGGKDTNPSPAMAAYSELKVTEIGGYIRRSLYADLGHSSWYRHWEEPDFVAFMNNAHKANPLIFFNRFEFCPDSGVNARLGITAGFYAYEWERDGQLIATRTNGSNSILRSDIVASFTGNEVGVREYGTYRVRFKRTAGSDWSAWSPRPAVIKPKAVTQTPPIQVAGIRSKVLPAPDGKNTVTLQMPEGYQNYQWIRVSDNVQVANTQIFEAAVGVYKARYTEQFGCGTLYSPEFRVVNANGSPKPDAAKNLSVSTVSQTSLRLDWSENPNAGTNETGFEIYRATKAGGPYTLIHITNANVTTFTDASLIPNTKYYYIVRAVAETGAAPVSEENSGTTDIDNVVPSAPYDLEYRGSTATTVSLRWKAANDNTGIGRYDIYANGVKMYSTSNLSFIVGNLDSLKSYAFVVKAVDKAGNVSPASNQVLAFTHRQGLNYKYYHGSYSNLPNFANLTPEKTGVMDTVNSGAGVRLQDDNFAFLWEGRIYIPVTATYTFETNSDDGSKLYIDVPYSFGATALVNNDGAHGVQSRTGSIYLTQGYHTIAISYAEVGGDNEMHLFWSNNAGLSRERLPKEFLSLDENASTPVNAPSSFSATALSHNKIKLEWIDNSSNETGFEIVRSTSMNGTFTPIFTAPANSISFNDSALSPNTTYYYKIRAIGSSGESPYVASYVEGNWRFNNNHNEANGGGSTQGSGTSFSSNDKAEGSHSISFSSGASVSFDGGNSSIPSLGGYNQRTVSLWIKPSSTSGKRMLFDFGNNDNGMGLRFNNGTLSAGIAGGGSRSTANLSNFTSNSNWQSNQWNHVAVVYNANSLTLFLNGVQVAQNNSLSFASVSNSNSASRLGNVSGSGSSQSVFSDNNYSSYQGLMDNLMIIRGALTAAEVSQLSADTYNSSMARTLAAPAAPQAPNGFTATAMSTNTVHLKWNDNSSNETGFEIWRSSGDKTNNRMIARVAASSGGEVTYTDSSLFANVTYYYRVRATGEVSPSAYTPEISAKTLNTKPLLKKVLNFTMKYGTTFSLPVSATDADGDVLTFSYISLPTFATVQQGSNGNINIVFSPPVTRRGAFPMTVIVTDGNNGSDSSYFTITVNTNDVPVMTSISDVTINEGGEASLSFSATDNNGVSKMVWSSEGLPAFGEFTNNNDGSGHINLKPGYSSSGKYEVTVFVNDGLGAWTSKTFVITVNDRDPEETVQFNFRSTSTPVAEWNSINLAPPTFSHGTVLNVKGNVSTIGVNLLSGTINASVQGPQTGNNSGVYPDLVMRDIMTWGFSMGTNRYDTVQLQVSGLDRTKQYSFVFYGGYRLNGISTSQVRYIIGNDTAAINYYLNSQMTDTISGVVPDASGNVVITMLGDPHNNRGGLLNAMVIKSSYDDGSTPAKPLKLTGNHIQNSGVSLTWEDRAFNEFGYKVYRSVSRTDGYVLLNEGASNRDSTSYSDEGVAPETTYYYYVVGFNGRGNGASSDTIQVITGNNKPVIVLSPEVYVKAETTTNVDFPVTDDAGDVVSVSIEAHPSFVSLQNLGNAQYRLVLKPNTDHIGWYTATLKAVDQKGATEIKVINIGVSDKNTRSVYINYGSIGKTAPAPWNNFLGVRTANSTLANLRDEKNTVTPFAITMVNSWASVSDLGHMTGKNNGIAPDSVLQSGIMDMTGPKTIRVSGLDNNKKYNIVIVASHNEGTIATVEYSSGLVKDTLNARYNMHQSANLNGLSPVDGQITFSTLRLSGNATSILNAIIVEEYDPSIQVLNPFHLYAEPAGVDKVDVSWNDRTQDEAAVNGYILERAKDSLFTQDVTEIQLPGNTTNYRDAGLSSNTMFWYRVRARSAAGDLSDYSNRYRVVTPASIVYLNFNYTLPDADYPWNNTFTSPSVEATFDNLINQSGLVSGISMSITRIFNGEFTAGVNTGNNSGIVPDKALASNYWIDNTQHSQIKVSGLNHSRRYRVGFFGSSSSVGWFKGNYTATYTVNGTTVYLNSWMNSSKVVYIDDLVPDENGELTLDFSTTEAAAYGFNAGVIIEDYTLPEEVSEVIASPLLAEPAVEDRQNGSAARAASNRPDKGVRMYPNPFIDFVNMDFVNDSESNKVSVEIYDLTGRLTYRRLVGHLPKGANTLRVNASEANLGTGVYVITLRVNGKVTKAGKMMKVSE